MRYVPDARWVGWDEMSCLCLKTDQSGSLERNQLKEPKEIRITSSSCDLTNMTFAGKEPSSRTSSSSSALFCSDEEMLQRFPRENISRSGDSSCQIGINSEGNKRRVDHRKGECRIRNHRDDPPSSPPASRISIMTRVFSRKSDQLSITSSASRSAFSTSCDYDRDGYHPHLSNHRRLFTFYPIAILFLSLVTSVAPDGFERRLSSRTVTTKYGTIRGVTLTLPNRNLQEVEAFFGKWLFDFFVRSISGWWSSRFMGRIITSQTCNIRLPPFQAVRMKEMRVIFALTSS